MKIAYLTSQYPAVSHTFIANEVQALRRAGTCVETFSVRKMREGDFLGDEAVREARQTRALVPPPGMELLLASMRMVLSRPGRVARALWRAVGPAASGVSGRLRGLAYFGEALLLAHWLDRGNFDHLHCHFGNNGSTTGMLAACVAGIPFSITCHGSELNRIDEMRLVQKARHAAFMAFVSHFGRAQLMARTPVACWDRFHIVRCAPRLKTKLRRRALPRAAGASRRPRLDILCVGRLSPEKGHPVLLDALRIVVARGINAHLTLVGDGPLRQQLESQVRRLRLGEHVHFAGALAPEDVAARYEQADVFALASFSEGVPVVLMEAMAAGVPVVATRVGGVAELVVHGHTGVIVPPGDAAAMAQALADHVEQPSATERRTASARKWLEQEFDVERSVKRLVSLFSPGGSDPVRGRETIEQEMRECPREAVSRPS